MSHASALAGVRAVVFDWDGTLVDTLPLKIGHAGLLFQERFGLPRAGVEAAYRTHSGIPRRALFDRIVADVQGPTLSDAQYAEISAAFTQLNRQTLDPRHLFSDVPPAFDALRRRGYRLAISSAAAPDEVRGGADRLGLTPSLDAVLGSDGAFAKGAAHLGHISEMLGVSTDALCVVGDERADMRLSRAAGARAVGRLGSTTDADLRAAGAQAVITDLLQLLPMLDETAAGSV